MEKFIFRQKNGLKYYQSSAFLKFKEIAHAFTLKEPFSQIKKNEKNIIEHLGLSYKNLIFINQIHSSRVVVVNKNYLEVFLEDTSWKIFPLEQKKEVGADALITNLPNIPLAMFYADCVPILIYEAKKNIIAIVHAGWRGSVKKVSEKTILVMKEKFGVYPKDCYAAIFPYIHPCCYEVDKLVLLPLKENFKNYKDFLNKKDKKFFLNLGLLNKKQLQNQGVLEKNISISPLCTYGEKDKFYSYRRDLGNTGRMMGVIGIIS